VSGGDHRWFKRSTGKKRPVTRHPYRIIIIIIIIYEIRAIWKQKAAQLIPLVTSSTTVIPKSLLQSLTRFNLPPNTYTQLQKSVILGTCSIVRNILNYKKDHTGLILLIATSQEDQYFPVEGEK